MASDLYNGCNRLSVLYFPFSESPPRLANSAQSRNIA